MDYLFALLIHYLISSEFLSSPPPSYSKLCAFSDCPNLRFWLDKGILEQSFWSMHDLLESISSTSFDEILIYVYFKTSNRNKTNATLTRVVPSHKSTHSAHWFIFLARCNNDNKIINTIIIEKLNFNQLA